MTDLSEPNVESDESVDLESVASVDRPGDERTDRLTIGLTVMALVVAAFTLFREAVSEPYHIDELRQVRPYARDLRELVGRSFSQDQPPLDVIVGARFQQVFGVGDVVQRGHSMLAGLIALSTLAVLLWRARIRLGIPAAVLLLAIAPGFVSFTAYARPYALPLALMVGFALATDLWLERGNRTAAAAVPVIALLLPLSRMVEPPMFLVFSMLVIGGFEWRQRRWGRRIWWPVGSALLALLVVEIPVYLKARERLNAYQGEESASIGEQWTRVVDDSIPRLASMFANGWIALAIAGIAVATPAVRRRLLTMWWFWPMVLTVGAFAAVFHLRTQPGQPFYDRYGYFWLPVFAVLVAVLVQEMLDSRNRRSWSAWLPMAALLPFALLSMLALNDDFDEQAQSDFRALGEQLEARLPVETTLIFDTTSRPLGSYRPGYAGYGRYTVPQRPIIKAELLPQQADRVVAGAPYVIGTNGPVLSIPGWTAVPTSQDMTLYIPDIERRGPDQLAVDLEVFGFALEPAFGAVFRIGAASVLFANDRPADACSVLDSLIADDPSLEPNVVDAFASSQFVDVVASCLAT